MAGEVGGATECAELETESNRELEWRFRKIRSWCSCSPSINGLCWHNQRYPITAEISESSRVEKELTGELHQELGEW